MLKIKEVPAAELLLKRGVDGVREEGFKRLKWLDNPMGVRQSLKSRLRTLS